MRILIISHEYPPIGGGGANACMYLAREFAKKKNDVYIISVWYEGTQEKEVIEYEGGTITLFRIKAKRKYKEHCSFIEMLDFIFKARKEIDLLFKSKCFDITQIFFGIPSGPLGLYIKKKYKIPYVIRFGGGDIPGFQNRFKILYKLLGYPLKVIWNKADGLVANSEGLKDFALSFYNKKEIYVIYNGVDTEKFFPGERCENSEVSNLLFVSRLIERKGLQDVIPYLNAIREKSGKEIHLTIVGDGPYRETLMQLAQKYGTTELISFEGQHDKNELLDYYQKGDVFIFPSRKEGMPNAVLEAMACGLPIIMNKRCQGCKELVDQNGILVEDNFADEISNFLKCSDKQKSEMGCRSRKKAIQNFSWEMTAEKYIDLFNEILS